MHHYPCHRSLRGKSPSAENPHQERRATDAEGDPLLDDEGAIEGGVMEESEPLQPWQRTRDYLRRRVPFRDRGWQASKVSVKGEKAWLNVERKASQFPDLGRSLLHKYSRAKGKHGLALSAHVNLGDNSSQTSLFAAKQTLLFQPSTKFYNSHQMSTKRLA
jgi:hypothetical protein